MTHMLRLRNYFSGEAHNVQSTIEWWGDGKVMMKLLDSSRLSRVVSAFGEFAAEHHLTSGISSKRILWRHDCFLGFWVTVGCHGNWWKSNYLNPTKEKLYEGVRANDERGLTKRGGKEGKRERERKRGWGRKNNNQRGRGCCSKKYSERDNWKRTIQLVFEAIFM